MEIEAIRYLIFDFDDGILSPDAPFGSKEAAMLARFFAICSGFLIVFALGLAAASPGRQSDDSIVRVRRAYSLSETVDRLKKIIAGKGIQFFSEIDQAKRAADAGIRLRPSVLL
jgi:hypothetical protein